jgi:hypothetical protein
MKLIVPAWYGKVEEVIEEFEEVNNGMSLGI